MLSRRIIVTPSGPPIHPPVRGSDCSAVVSAILSGIRPITRKRFNRLRRVLDRRQPDLTVLLENVHKPHNFAAIVRTCDAVGALEAHAVYPSGRIPRGLMAAAGSESWVGVCNHPDLAAAVGELHGLGFRLLAADPAPGAEDFRTVDYTQPTAVVLGQEKEGVSAAVRAAVDERISIPMLGAGASLNVSVAAALILFEAQRQRLAAGLYNHSRLTPERYDRLLFEWCYPKIATICRGRGSAYPRLGPDGELLDPVPR